MVTESSVGAEAVAASSVGAEAVAASSQGAEMSAEISGGCGNVGRIVATDMAAQGSAATVSTWWKDIYVVLGRW